MRKTVHLRIVRLSVTEFMFSSDGPAESRRKPTAFSLISSPTTSSSSSSYPWSPASSISPLDEHAPSYYPQITNMLPLKHVQQPTPPSPSPYPKTICLHCKSHNMPECLYTCKKTFALFSKFQMFLFLQLIRCTIKVVKSSVLF